MSEQIKDRALIKQYIQGNEACLEMLINKHKNKVFTTILLIVNDTYIAEDLFQETFIKVIKTFKSGKYNEEGKFLPWVVRIARNLAIDHFRKSKRMPTITSQDGEDIFRTIEIGESNREESFIQNQRDDTVRQIINMLPAEQKEVLVLRHYGDMSFKEIAELTGVSINTALGRMRYALNNMRKIISEKSITLQ
ncbi:MAG: sigma-70 family RNA polymerase sigma factor [Bacteroidetes bacterium]|jgi:RNA polymerase sigma factor (sigma-70 family)|nr:sigma-70 family RNA polymerase sigma factor [Bacteroidota bacterium]